MVVSLAVEFHRIQVRIEDGNLTGCAGGDFTNAPERQFKLGGDACDGRAVDARGSETEFVIVAACQLAFKGDTSQIGKK